MGRGFLQLALGGEEVCQVLVRQARALFAGDGKVDRAGVCA